MDKKGSNLVIVSMFFVFLLLFVTIKYNEGFTITGLATANLGGSGLDIQDIVFVKLNFVRNDVPVISSESFFFKDDTIACFVDYSSQSNNDFDVGFFTEGKDDKNPDVLFKNILTSNLENIRCDPSTTACMVSYDVQSSKIGNWNCFVKANDQSVVSNSLRMKNRAPILINDIQDIYLNVDGSYIGSPINLNDYFNDLDSSNLQYSAFGHKGIEIAVGNDGVVLFSNPLGLEGNQTIKFRAFDGEVGGFSNEVIIYVGGSGPGEGFDSICHVIWDCKWTECKDGLQNCIYFDKNNCSVPKTKPQDLVRSCVVNAQGVVAQSGLVQGSLPEALKLNPGGEKLSAVTGLNRILLIVGLILAVLIVISMVVLIVYKVYNKDKEPLISNFGNESKVSIFSKLNFFSKSKTGGVVDNKTISTEDTTQKIKPEDSKQLVSNTTELNDYIYNAISAGETDDKIKSDLLKAGWKQIDITNSLDYVKLKRFVDSKIKQGAQKDNLLNLLRSKGWKSSLIDSVF